MKRNLIIIGSAPCAMEDFLSCLAHAESFRTFAAEFDVMAIGLDAVAIVNWPLEYVATNHVEDIPAIRRRREAFQGNTDYKLVSYKHGPGVDIVQPLGPVSGSSAILGALAGITMGYDRIVLCGCPLTGNAPEGNPYEAFRPGWTEVYEAIKDNVRSMSGWTRELLGAPNKRWLNGHDRITIGACWDGREYYPSEYVNRLFNACCRNTTIPFDFVLYVGPEAEKPGRTSAIAPEIRIVPVGLPYWWSGMAFWKKDPPGIDTDTILYLDLDQVIVGSLDDIIRYPSSHACMKDWPTHNCPPGLERDACVSTSLIRNGAASAVWEAYEAAGKPVWNPLTEKGPLPMATQGIVNDQALGIPHDLFPENWVCSYKLEVLKRGGLPDDCRIVAFHGRPKQHEVIHKEPWIMEHWR